MTTENQTPTPAQPADVFIDDLIDAAQPAETTPEVGAEVALDSDKPAAEETPADPVPEEPPFVPTVSKQDVEYKYSPYDGDLLKAKRLANPVHTVIPADTRSQIHAAMTETSNTNYSASASGRLWASTMLDSIPVCPADDVTQDALERPGSVWRQSVATPGGELIGSYAKFKEKPGQTVVSGDSAIIRLQQHLSLGTSYRVPLWNTGIWVTFRAPSEPALMELERALTSDKIELGRNSYGLTYSNTTAVFNDRVVSFAMEQIWNTTLKAPSGNYDLREIISNHDIPALLLGLAAAIWPDGFNHSRPCIANPDKCTHTIQELIHIPKTLLVDTAALTAWQITHMAKTTNNAMSVEDVKRYKQEMLVAQDQEIVLCEGQTKQVTMKLRVPSVVEFINAGNIWINEMVNMVDNALGREVSNERRNQYIIEHGKSTNLRQYGQWITGIRFGSDLTEDDDRETINGMLGVLSGDDELRIEFMEKIGKFIAASTVTVVGVPSFVCPVCKGVNRSTKGHPTITEAIPYDPLQVFFDLIVQRVQKISDR